MRNCFKNNYTASQQINDNTCAIEKIATDLDEYKTNTNNELDTLSNRIDTNVNRIAGEANLREQGDNQLQNKITQEASAREAADANLQQQINEIETGGQGDMKSTDYPNLVKLESKLDMSSGSGYGFSIQSSQGNSRIVANNGYTEIDASGANVGSSPNDQIRFTLQAGNTPTNEPNQAVIFYGENFGTQRNLLKPLNDYFNLSADEITQLDDGTFLISGQASRRLDLSPTNVQWERTPSDYKLPIKSGSNVNMQIKSGTDGSYIEIAATASGGSALDPTTQLIVDRNPTYTHIDNELVAQYTARFRTGAQPPYTFSNDFTLTLPINLQGSDGVVVDVAESGNAIEIHSERQQLTTTFAQAREQINTLIGQAKRIISISFSTSKDITATATRRDLTDPSTTTQISSIIFRQGYEYVFYYIGQGEKFQGCGEDYFNSLELALQGGNAIVLYGFAYINKWIDNVSNQDIYSQISTESIVIEYE